MMTPSDIHTLTLTDFKRNATRLLQRLEESVRPQVITVGGRPRAVLLSVEGFERLALLAERGAQVGEPPAAVSPTSASGREDERAAVRVRQAFELLALAQALLEQRVRREDPQVTQAAFEARLAAQRTMAAGDEEAPGYLTRSAERLRKLLA